MMRLINMVSEQPKNDIPTKEWYESYEIPEKVLGKISYRDHAIFKKRGRIPAFSTTILDRLSIDEDRELARYNRMSGRIKTIEEIEHSETVLATFRGTPRGEN